jgi:hypothetical protein
LKILRFTVFCHATTISILLKDDSFILCSTSTRIFKFPDCAVFRATKGYAAHDPVSVQLYRRMANVFRHAVFRPRHLTRSAFSLHLFHSISAFVERFTALHN